VLIGAAHPTASTAAATIAAVWLRFKAAPLGHGWNAAHATRRGCGLDDGRHTTSGGAALPSYPARSRHRLPVGLSLGHLAHLGRALYPHRARPSRQCFSLCHPPSRDSQPAGSAWCRNPPKPKGVRAHPETISRAWLTTRTRRLIVEPAAGSAPAVTVPAPRARLSSRASCGSCRWASCSTWGAGDSGGRPSTEAPWYP